MIPGGEMTVDAFLKISVPQNFHNASKVRIIESLKCLLMRNERHILTENFIFSNNELKKVFLRESCAENFVNSKFSYFHTLLRCEQVIKTYYFLPSFLSLHFIKDYSNFISISRQHYNHLFCLKNKQKLDGFFLVHDLMEL